MRKRWVQIGSRDGVEREIECASVKEAEKILQACDFLKYVIEVSTETEDGYDPLDDYWIIISETKAVDEERKR